MVKSWAAIERQLNFRAWGDNISNIMGMRRELRLYLALKVRVWGLDANGRGFEQDATTVDITGSGARLAGITCSLRSGCRIWLQHRGCKGNFWVRWVGKPETDWQPPIPHRQRGWTSGTLRGIKPPFSTCSEPRQKGFRGAWASPHVGPSLRSAQEARTDAQTIGRRECQSTSTQRLSP